MLIGTEGFQAEVDQGLRILQVFSTSSFVDAASINPAGNVRLLWTPVVILYLLQHSCKYLSQWSGFTPLR